jgi:hypothetical protein
MTLIQTVAPTQQIFSHGLFIDSIGVNVADLWIVQAIERDAAAQGVELLLDGVSIGLPGTKYAPIAYDSSALDRKPVMWDETTQRLVDASASLDPSLYLGVVTAAEHGARLDGSDDTVAWNAAVLEAHNRAVALGGRVLVQPGFPGGRSTLTRKTAGVGFRAGGIELLPGVSIDGQGTQLLLADNCTFIWGSGTLSTSPAALTGSVASGDVTLNVDSTATLTVGGWVWITMGLSPYDATSVDYWLLAKVLSKTSLTVTIDRPVSYNYTYNATDAYRHVTAAVPLVGSTVANFDLVNPKTGSANAESGVSFYVASNCHVENITGTDCGAGVVTTGRCESISARNIRALSATTQPAGNFAKGRVISISTTRGVSIENLYGENFENSYISAENRCTGISIRDVTVANTFPTRDNTTANPFFNTVAGSFAPISLRDVTIVGKGGALTRPADVYCEFVGELSLLTSPRCDIPNLKMVTGSINSNYTYWRSVSTVSRTMALKPSVTNFLRMPDGLVRRWRIYVLTKTGIINSYVGNGSGGNSADLTSSLVANQMIEITGSGLSANGFGPSYAINELSPNWAAIVCDGTVPPNAYCIVEAEVYILTSGDTQSRGMSFPKDRFALETPPNVSYLRSDETAAGAALRSALATLGLITDLTSSGFVQGSDLYDAGEPAMPRHFASATAALVASRVQLQHFTARRTESITQLRMTTAGTIAAGLTLGRLGVYSVGSNGDLTLITASTSDTTMFGTANAQVTKTLGATWNKVQGQRYAIGVILTGTTMPTVYGGLSVSLFTGVQPRLNSILTGQTDFPSTIANASLSSAAFNMFVEAIP